MGNAAVDARLADVQQTATADDFEGVVEAISLLPRHPDANFWFHAGTFRCEPCGLRELLTRLVDWTGRRERELPEWELRIRGAGERARLGAG